MSNGGWQSPAFVPGDGEKSSPVLSPSLTSKKKTTQSPRPPQSRKKASPAWAPTLFVPGAVESDDGDVDEDEEQSFNVRAKSEGGLLESPSSSNNNVRTRSEGGLSPDSSRRSPKRYNEDDDDRPSKPSRGDPTFRSRPVSTVPTPLVDPRATSQFSTRLTEADRERLKAKSDGGRPRSPLPPSGRARSPVPLSSGRGRSPVVPPPSGGRHPRSPLPPSAREKSPLSASGRSAPSLMESPKSGAELPRRPPFSPRQSPETKDGKSGGVNWNQDLFITLGTDNSDRSSSSNHMDDDDEFDEDHVPQMRRRSEPGTVPTLLRRGLSKKESLIVDRKMLESRMHWNQALLLKAFRPYRRAICENDDDLPDPDDLDGIDAERKDGAVYDDPDNLLAKIRDEMLLDPDLTEREIAAFFEGIQLFQLKCNSLQAQIRGLEVMKREEQFLPSRSVWATSRNLLQDAGKDFHSTRELKSPTKEEFEASSPAPSDRRSLLLTVRTSISGDPTQEPKRREPATKRGAMTPQPPMSSEDTKKRSAEKRVSNGDSPPDMAPQRQQLQQPRSLNRSLRALSIKRIKETTTEGAIGKGGEDIQKLLADLEEAEKRQKKLEKQLAQAGVAIAEDIPYDVAKKRVQEIATRMGEIGSSDVTDPDKEKQASLREEYFKLEQDMEKYTTALQLTDEWVEEQEEMERHWEESNREENHESLKRVRRHMPVDVRNRSEAELSTEPTPNGKYMPKAMAKKFKRTNVLQLLRLDPDNDIVRMHPSTLENMRVVGLTLTERRALYAHLETVGPRWKSMQAEKMTERKWTWYKMMKSNFKENLGAYQRHVEQYGPPGNHPYATREDPSKGCPMIGKQCPLRADKLMDYDGDLGFPEGAEYMESNVKKSTLDDDPGAKAKQEALELAKVKKEAERSEALKKHYGNVLQVARANGSCESMDECMDNIEIAQEKWINTRLEQEGKPPTDEIKRKELSGFSDILNEFKLSLGQFAEKSGMQLTGRRDVNADQPDNRSAIELGLCDEVIETAEDLFEGMTERMTEIGARDGRIKSTMQQLQQLMDELKERNESTLAKLGVDKPARSRKFKSRAVLLADAKKAAAAAAPPVAAEEETVADRGGGGGGRGDLLGAIAGRGRGGGGRGDLLGAIAGRGRGRGRGDLMGAIAARGRGGDGGRGGRGGGGRGGLMAAIAARGGGGNDAGGGGGRGGLMAAIAARGAK